MVNLSENSTWLLAQALLTVGSYYGAGNLQSNVNTSGKISGYARWLDLDTGIASATWKQDGTVFTRESFCSNPTKACFQHLCGSTKAALPTSTFSFTGGLEPGFSGANVTCMDNSTLQVRGTAGTPGMLYELLFRAHASGGKVSCSKATPEPGAASNATLTISGSTETWLAWVGETEFDLYKGNPASNFSFQGPDPHAANNAILEDISASYSSLRSAHVLDFASALGDFQLSLGNKPDLSTLPPTSEVMAGYQVDVGNTWLEWVLFNYGRYMLASSSRGVLPANLQGKWANGSGNPWSADYRETLPKLS